MSFTHAVVRSEKDVDNVLQSTTVYANVSKARPETQQQARSCVRLTRYVIPRDSPGRGCQQGRPAKSVRDEGRDESVPPGAAASVGAALYRQNSRATHSLTYQVLEKGELQVSDKERKSEYDTLFRARTEESPERPRPAADACLTHYCARTLSRFWWTSVTTQPRGDHTLPES